ncbi:replication-association protein [Chimpanzee stool avian-like circovirus Chimp17]|uniref:Replication-associated protein n=1 Tax=Chimpanzee stool avian-like circovirus Chimp17 TaxID=743290 RepID=D4N3Q0_9CIRC|nr:replication-association protein [Chimpanzee stool avian-like circovirus Chimp17]ADD62465.1 replication-association protein [Chimpanzee stool avian-like circovirus Chimp17]
MAPIKRPAPCKRWCFTLNNFTDDEVQKVVSLQPDEVHYAIVGRETGAQGTPHLQGYLHLKKKKRLTSMKEFLPRAHWEVARGSDEDNEAYCSKEGDVILTLGIPAKGNRSDLSGAVAAVKAGRQMREIARDFSEVYVKYGRGLRELALLIGQKPRDFKTEVIVLTGPSGVGKSRWANEQEGAKFYKMKGDWWDGYSNEDIVVIDDFYGWIPFCELLRLTDRYPHKVPVKGAYVEFTSKKIIITSNTPPESWYNEEKCYVQALFRRINKWMIWNATGFEDAPDCMKKYPINY